MRERTNDQPKPKPSYVESGGETRVEYLPVGGYTQMRGGALFEAGDDEFDTPMIDGRAELARRLRAQTREDGLGRTGPVNGGDD